MFSRSTILLMVLLGVLSNLRTDVASAQVGRRLAYKAARVEARARNLVNRIILRRQGIVGADGAVPGQPPTAVAPDQPRPTPQPMHATPQQPTLADGPVEQASSAEVPAWSPSRPLPIGARWQALENGELLNRWRDITNQFHNELDSLSTAEGWHRYLGVEENFSGSPSSISSEIDVAELQKLLDRFDRVSVSPEFQKVSRLPSFAANHAALEEIVSRFTGPHLKEPQEKPREIQEQSPLDSVESLPPPKPVSEKPHVPNGERSILKNS